MCVGYEILESKGTGSCCYSIEFYFALCIPTSYVFQRQYPSDIFMRQGQYSLYSLYVTYIFNTLYGLYTIWKELKQLQPQDQHFKQSKASKPFIQTSPPLDEFLTEVREQLIIFIQTSPPLGEFLTKVREQLIIFIQTSPLFDEFLTEVREQLIVFSSPEQTSSIQDIQQKCSDTQVFHTEQLLLSDTSNIFIVYDPGSRNCAIFVCYVNSFELHL